MMERHRRFNPRGNACCTGLWRPASSPCCLSAIGAVMICTVRPVHLTLVSIHKPLGIAILVLVLIRLALLRYGAPALPPICLSR